MTEEMRIEHDSMGEIEVPATALWGAQTQRAVANFPISGQRIPMSLIRGLVWIKWAAARTNADLGILDAEVSNAIVSVCEEVLGGAHDDQFPIDIYQTGSGTSSNMNVNEVIARLASSRLGKPVLPNDHVNASQSSNDVFPTAMHLGVLLELSELLLPALNRLVEGLERKAAEFSEVVKSGRTHLMDATPITLGQEFSGYAAAIRRSIVRIELARDDVGEVPLGGTAVGTGLNAPPGFADGVLMRLRERLNVPIREASNHFEAHGARDAIVFLSGALKTLAMAYYKLANDLRWMSSGPRCGLGEIHLPDLQPGSSIMPGKVNPVVPEAMCQVVARVIGNDATIAFGGSAGNFELNVMQPIMGVAVLDSMQIMATIADAMVTKCVNGIEANVERCRTYALSSPSIGTSLNPYIGYEQAAKVIKEALATDKDLRTVVLEKGLLSEAEVDVALDVMAMTKGGIIR
ncbi:class II fumarate hydratase [Ferrimicrobium acidiphilum]|jgi:fumarate hydratase class II|uniref:class II fumarate hydratase n=1 Tax=Ferrimicrobium acidiphilum TaxID=121039 RepID=UPI0023EF856B|nr:class II fumarate hydratase [Ferrimicrobium acidiphilum]